MGYRLEVAWRPVLPEFTRSEWRSWRLRRRLSMHLTRSSLEQWRPTIKRNLERLRSAVRGQPHLRNLDRWESLLDRGDVTGIHRILTGLDRDSIEMREVSPVGGVHTRQELTATGGTLALAGPHYQKTKTLWVTGLAERLPLYDSVAEATAALPAATPGSEQPTSAASPACHALLSAFLTRHHAE